MSWTVDACKMKANLEAPENVCAGIMTVTAQQSFLLFGINACLFGYYVLHRFRDSWSILCLVTWVSIVELFTCAAHIALLLEFFASTLHRTAFEFAWVADMIPLITVSASLPVQLFLICRVNKLSKSPVLTGFLGFLSLFSALMSLGTKRIALEYEWPAAICNLGLAVSLLWYLKEEKDADFEQRLQIIVECALPVVFICIGDIIFATVVPPSGWRGLFEFSLSRLYSTTLFTTLNARAPKEAPDMDEDTFVALVEKRVASCETEEEKRVTRAVLSFLL
ncbi:uncharacterized protein EV420DRAFT_1185242 [Desarmillaria tabescens]|uniref:DUF6534 domain-containing protein n=1 Tax=Armillaria tabescens TaxID=1929756 RepID=A0AA39TXJ8_ARMTA|nr:uncharacterized protein EV420DRAFT_1185242 [Desarmillaria tabescens]KAK0462405.1 hypothetical protein EV420DRAFT_1185242 [Desarmillaria tabescens]